MQFWALNDGWKNRLKHAERLTKIKKFRNVASCWFCFENYLMDCVCVWVCVCVSVCVCVCVCVWEYFCCIYGKSFSCLNTVVHKPSRSHREVKRTFARSSACQFTLCNISPNKICRSRTFTTSVAYIQGVSKRALQLWKRIEIYTEDIHNVLNCQNVANHTEFYLG